MDNCFWVMLPFGNDYFDTPYAVAEPVGKQNIGDVSDLPKCPVCGVGMGMRPWFPPQRIWLSKARYPDFLFSGFSLFVSDRFRVLYEQAGLTGITRFDPAAQIDRIAGKPLASVQRQPPEYRFIWYVHDGADLDDDRSGVQRKPGLCGKCRRSLDGIDRIVLKDNSWTGADFFEAFGLPGKLLVSRRAKEMVIRNSLTGCTLVPAEKYHYDSHKPPKRFR